MGRRDHRSDRGLVEGDKGKTFGVPPGESLFLIGTVAAESAQGGVAWEHEQTSQEMQKKLLLWLRGFLTTSEYTLEQSHDVSPFVVALANTT
jgi:hypothetical protein